MVWGREHKPLSLQIRTQRGARQRRTWRLQQTTLSPALIPTDPQISADSASPALSNLEEHTRIFSPLPGVAPRTKAFYAKTFHSHFRSAKLLYLFTKPLQPPGAGHLRGCNSVKENRERDMNAILAAESH